MGKILVTSRSFSSGDLDLFKFLSDQGFNAKMADSKHELSELAQELPDCVGWIAGTSKVTSEMMDLAPNLKVIARYGVGFESVDLKAASERGIVVTNTPGANSLAVAELTLGLILTSLRGIVPSALGVRSSDWSVIRGRALEESTVGIIGFGRIGRILAQKLTALGCKIWVHDPFVKPEDIAALGYTAKEVNEISAGADIVSLHAPGDGALVTSDWVHLAKPGQLIINSARAELVDESAIAKGLREGKLSAYAADTLQGEKNSANSPLLAVDIANKVVITAHLGAQTVGAIDLMGKISCENAVAVLTGKPAMNPVN